MASGNFTLQIDAYEVELRPMTTITQLAARSAATHRIHELEKSWKDIVSVVDLAEDGKIDLSCPTERDAVYQAFQMQEVALRHIVGWNLADVKGKPLAVTREAVLSFIRMPPIGQQIWNALILNSAEAISAKKAFGVVPSGTSRPAPNTAATAANKANPAAKD